MGKRTCLFCDDPATSLEHVWPVWILALLPERRPIRQRLLDGPEVTYRGDFKIRCVCAGCNNGWMSNLEVLASPVMTPMVLGESVVLNRQDQELIARWAIKTAMIVEGTKSKEIAKFFDEAVRSRFMREGVFPSSVVVWIGRCNESGVFSNAANFIFTVDGSIEKGYGSVTTIIAGCLVIQILGVLMPSSAINGISLPMRGNHWDISLAQIYPATNSSTNWPPTITFHNLGGFMSLSELKYRWNPNDDGSSEPRL